jgi:hypothetical protein
LHKNRQAPRRRSSSVFPGAFVVAERPQCQRHGGLHDAAFSRFVPATLPSNPTHGMRQASSLPHAAAGPG